MGVDKKLEKKVFTIQEIWAAMRGSVEKSKKKYTRKDKHKKSGGEGYQVLQLTEGYNHWGFRSPIVPLSYRGKVYACLGYRGKCV